MVRTSGRNALWAYALLLLLAAVGYARYDAYLMDGDGTAFLDIAQYLNTHRAALAINGYWNPAYPAVLAFFERIGHPTLWHELVLVRFVNVLIFALAIVASLWFTTGLLKARALRHPRIQFAVPNRAMHLLVLGMLTISLGRELPVAAPRSDTLLFSLLMFAGGLLVRAIEAPRNSWTPAAMGVVLGVAYLTKSFAFLPTMAILGAFLVAALAGASGERKRRLQGTALFAVLFGLIAGPYIAAISRQLGHFTTGESARLNYAFFVDMTPRWHEWYRRDLGHAGGAFLHPEAVLAAPPPVFSYAAHPQGTFPLWFDPAWWTLGLKPHVWLKGHVLRLLRNVVVLFRFVLGRPEVFVLLGVLLGFGAGWPRLRADEATGSKWWKAWLWGIVPVAWGLLMFGIYLPIDFQDRYLTAPLYLVLLPVFACLQTSRRDVDASRSFPLIAKALIVLFAGVALTQAVTYLADKRRHIPVDEQHHAGYDQQIFTAAAALDALGLHPGDRIACMGDVACYTDHYWARVAGVQIEAQVDTPDEEDPLQVWNKITDKRRITTPLAGMGLKYLVSLFPNSASKPAGWIQLGATDFFAYPLQSSLNAEEVKRVETLKPVP